jgi:hypothetical protein
MKPQVPAWEWVYWEHLGMSVLCILLQHECSSTCTHAEHAACEYGSKCQSCALGCGRSYRYSLERTISSNEELELVCKLYQLCCPADTRKQQPRLALPRVGWSSVHMPTRHNGPADGRAQLR